MKTEAEIVESHKKKESEKKESGQAEMADDDFDI